MTNKVKNNKKPRKNQVSNDKKIKSNVIVPKHSGGNTVSIELDQYPNWTHALKIREFTNAYKDERAIGEYFYFIVDKLLPFLKEHGYEIITNKFKHCHIINEPSLSIARNVINELHGPKVSDTATLWQFGLDKGIRIVGSITFGGNRDEVNDDFCHIIPLFIDEYHVLYPDERFGCEYKNHELLPQTIY